MASKMLNKVNGISSSIFLSAIALLFPSNVSADEIALTFEAHDLTLVGEFVAYEDDKYIIATKNGEVHVPVAMVSCKGTACAALSVRAADS